MEKSKGKKELPVYIVATLIFLSSLAFLGFAVYYIAFLPVPMKMQPLKIRLLTVLQVDEAIEKKEILKEEIIDETEEENYEKSQLLEN
jgi:hypothetical protein